LYEISQGFLSEQLSSANPVTSQLACKTKQTLNNKPLY